MQTKRLGWALLSSVLVLCAGTSTHAQLCIPDPVDENIVYNDLVQPPIYSWTYDTMANTEATPTGRNGDHAIVVMYTRMWSEFILFRNTDDQWKTEDKRVLVFRVKGIQDNCSKQVWVHLRNQDETGAKEMNHLGSVKITDHMVSPRLYVTAECWDNPTATVGLYDPDEWYTVAIPLSAFAITDNKVKEIMFEGGNLADYAAGDFGTIYLDDIWWVDGLEFPLHGEGDGPYTTTIQSVLDHSRHADKASRDKQCPNNIVTAYTGEEGVKGSNGVAGEDFSEWDESMCGSTVYGLPDIDGMQFSLNGQYDQTETVVVNGVRYLKNEGGYFLFYDGHSGLDCPKTNAVPQYVTASGTVSCQPVQGPYEVRPYVAVVTHQDGSETVFPDLSWCEVEDGASVAAGARIGWKEGTPVFAAADGVAYNYSYANMPDDEFPVRINHQNGYESFYLHMRHRTVKNGTPVSKGDLIGWVGRGHMHFHMRLYGELVDPYGWTDESRSDPLGKYVVSVPLWEEVP